MKLALSAEERAPLSISVARRIRAAIVAGELGMGTELPSEKELAKELKVGRSTVREALRILQAQGLLSGGDTVSTTRPRVSNELTLATAASTMENALRLNAMPLRDLVELRVVVEGAAATAAAALAPSDLTDARDAVSVMKRRGIDVEEFRRQDLRFHRALAGASQNVAFALVMDVLRSAISGHLGEALHREERPAATIARLAQEHERILDAVASGRGERARELVTAHIQTFYEART